MPDVISFGLGGGSLVQEKDPLSIGPTSVGNELAQKSKVFGGYVSIISTGLTTKAKVDKYKGTTAKNYDFTYENLPIDDVPLAGAR